MPKKFHEYMQDLLQGKDIDIDAFNNCEDIAGEKCNGKYTKEDLLTFRNYMNNVEVFSLTGMYKGAEHSKFHYNKEDSKNIYDGYIIEFMHEDFYYDFINDIKSFDIVNSVTPILKTVKNIVEKYYPPLTKVKDIKRSEWKKIYKYKAINYKEPIKYDYFKEIISTTPSLIPLLVMEVDLYHQLQKINKTAKLFFGSYFKLDEVALLQDILVHKVDCCAESETTNDILCTITSDIQFFNGWLYQSSFVLNYWFWIWFYYTFAGNSMEVIDNIFKKNEEFITEMNAGFGLSPRPDFDNNDKNDNVQRIAHNAYTKEDINEWIKCRDIYNLAIEEYRLISFVLKNKKENIPYEATYKKIGSLSLEEDQYIEYKNMVNDLFTKNVDNWFDSFLELLYYNYHLSYNVLYEELELDSLNKMIKFIESNNKKSYALYVVKNNCSITSNKSDKTISNRISEIEYGLKKNTIKKISTEEKEEKFQNLDEIDKIKELLKEIYNGFHTYLNFSIPNNKCLLLSKINDLEKILKQYKKSQAKI